jgi:hypothetical protein
MQFIFKFIFLTTLLNLFCSSSEGSEAQKWISSRDFKRAKELADFFMLGLTRVTRLKGENKFITLRDVYKEDGTETNYKLSIEFLAESKTVVKNSSFFELQLHNLNLIFYFKLTTCDVVIFYDKILGPQSIVGSPKCS